MKERVDDKIKEVGEFLSDLESYVPSSFEEYVSSHKTKDACERCFEKIVEALADLSFLVIKWMNFGEAKDDIGAFDVLAKRGVISRELSEKMKDAKGMRNILSRQYGKVDNTKVYDSIKDEIVVDAQEFIKRIGELK